MIVQAICSRYKADLLRSADVHKIALYTAAARLSADTEAYTPVGEVSGAGYTAGGQVLAGLVVMLKDETAVLDWATDPVWPVSTITARGALIYNETQQRRAVAVLDFGEDIVSKNGPFRVLLPPATVGEALIRMA